MSIASNHSAGMTQLMRYVLTIDNMCAPDCIV